MPWYKQSFMKQNTPGDFSKRADTFVRQKLRHIHWQGPPTSNPASLQRLKMYTDTVEHIYTEVMTDIHIQIPWKPHKDNMEVKVYGRADSYLLPM